MYVSLATISLGEIDDLLARVVNTPLGKHWNVVALLYSELCNTPLGKHWNVVLLYSALCISSPGTSPLITLSIGRERD